jgi:hypothetical protein
VNLSTESDQDQFANATEMSPTAAECFTWGQPEPTRKVPRAVKGVGMPDGQVTRAEEGLRDGAHDF